MTKRSIPIVREGSLVLLGHVAGMIGMLVGIRFVTELLRPDQYGELALALTLAAVLSQCVFGPLANAATRFYAPAVEKGTVAGYLGEVWSLARVALTLAGGLLVASVVVLLSLGYGVTWALLAAGAIVYTAAAGLSSTLSGIQNAARKRAVVAFHQVIDVWLRIGLAVLLLVTFGSSSAAAILGYAAGTCLVLGSQYLWYRRLFPSRRRAAPASVWRGDVWGYAWPFSAWGVFTWVQLSSDRWALDWFATRDDVGYLGVLAQLGAAPITLATSIAVQLIAPILFERAGDAADRERNEDVARVARRLTRNALVVAGFAFAATLLLHRLLFELFVSEEYAHVSYLLPWVVLSGGVFAASQTIALHLMTQLRVQAMLTAKIATALIGIAANVTGAMLFGIVGVVAANLLFSTSSLLWMLALSAAVARDHK